MTSTFLDGIRKKRDRVVDEQIIRANDIIDETLLDRVHNAIDSAAAAGKSTEFIYLQQCKLGYDLTQILRLELAKRLTSEGFITRKTAYDVLEVEW